MLVSPTVSLSKVLFIEMVSQKAKKTFEDLKIIGLFWLWLYHLSVYLCDQRPGDLFNDGTWKSSIWPQSFCRLHTNDWNIVSSPALAAALALNCNNLLEERRERREEGQLPGRCPALKAWWRFSTGTEWEPKLLEREIGESEREVF